MEVKTDYTIKQFLCVKCRLTWSLNVIQLFKCGTIYVNVIQRVLKLNKPAKFGLSHRPFCGYRWISHMKKTSHLR